MVRSFGNVEMLRANFGYFRPFSMSSMLGSKPDNLSGTSLDSSYSDIPMGALMTSTAYCASTLSLVLQINSPNVGASPLDFRMPSTA